MIYYLLRGIIKVFEHKASIDDDLLYAIGYFIMFLSSLIYNEFIILHFCGLNKNTKIFVEHRQNAETIELSSIKGNIILEDIKNKYDDERHVSIDSDYYLYENN